MDIVSYDGAIGDGELVTNDGLQFSNGGLNDELFLRQTGVVEDIEINVNDTINETGKLDVDMVIDSALDRVAKSEVDSCLFKSPGMISFSDFNKQNYFDIVGVENAEEMQQSFDTRQNNRVSSTLTDESETLTVFLPSETRPTFHTPPLSILPTNSEGKLLGVTVPLMGGNVNESNANYIITAMDLDQSLLKTTKANAKASTTAADINVLIDNKHKDYGNQLKHLENNEKKASYIMKMLVEDAIKTGRISQNNLLISRIVQICNILYKAILVLLTKQSSYFERQNLEIINVDMVESQDLPYFSLIYNDIATGLTMFEVSRNIFNVKMREVTEADFRENTEGDRLSVFKTYLYHLFHEYHMSNVDDLIPFRSETKFREATIIRYQNLSPQAQCRNFFIMLDNYLL